MQKFFKNLKHRAEYLVLIIIIKTLGLFGIDRSASICSYLARKIGPLLSFHKIAKKNLQTIFPNAANHERMDHEKILEEIWDNFGRFIGEFPYMNRLSEEQLAERIEIIGLEHIVEFQKSNQPFFLFSGHFANWDFALKIIPKLYHKFIIIYRHANNPYVDQMINEMRSNENMTLIAKGAKGARQLIKSIKQHYAVTMLVDQKMNDGIKVPFLGKPAMTSEAIAKLARQFNYPIVPVQIIRTNGSYFKIIIHPSLSLAKTENSQVDCYNIMATINEILGGWVKQKPGQWFWFHNRWGKGGK